MAIREYKKGQPVKLTANFYSTEFDCHCRYATCTTTKIDDLLVKRLQEIRDYTGKKVMITGSGYRCKKYNAIIPGAVTNSQHIKGKAADINIEDVQPSCVQKKMQEGWFKNGGVGVYKTFTHVDTGPKRRWVHSKPSSCTKPFPKAKDGKTVKNLEYWKKKYQESQKEWEGARTIIAQLRWRVDHMKHEWEGAKKIMEEQKKVIEKLERAKRINAKLIESLEKGMLNMQKELAKRDPEIRINPIEQETNDIVKKTWSFVSNIFKKK